MADWYKIREIDPSHFVECCAKLYEARDNQHTGKNIEDPFLKAIRNLSEAEWKAAEQVRLNHKAMEMAMGNFHQDLMGKFPGYETLPRGHVTKCDVIKKDGTEVFEVKNKHNTMKGSDGKHTIEILKTHRDAGMKAVLVEVNCPGGKVNRYGAPPEADVWNGKETYEYLSGRDTFFHDLLQTIQHAFANYKTPADLKQALGIS